jgi:hypothetical protein
VRFSRALLLVGVAAVGAPSPQAIARDEVPVSPTLASRIILSVGLGYSYPVASAEQGTDTRDVSFGIVPLSLSGSYDLDQRWNGSVRVLYAPNIPTLCASGPDCFSSVGRDVWIAAGVERTLPRWRRLTPQLELEVGWEWFTSKLTDSRVTSERSWNGPVASLEVFVNIKTGGPWNIGPTASIGAGIFSHYNLETPAGRSEGATATAIHAWPMIGLRIGRRL